MAARTDQLQAAQSDFEHSLDVALETFADVIDLRHAARKGRSRRIAAFAVAISRAMGLSREEIATIARARSHMISARRCSERDTVQAWEAHSRQDQDYPGSCSQRLPVKNSLSKGRLEIVYSHQERFDGTGYPRGLKGKEIPIGARVFSVADTLDAITCDHPYRPSQSIQAARRAIEKWSGTQFDPDIVRVFLTMPAEVWDGLDKALKSEY